MTQKVKTLTQKAVAALTVLSLLAGNFALLPMAADAALVPGGAVGPTNPNTGFSVWYMDQNGLALDLMEAADTFGISDPVDPANAFSQQIGFNAEGFWWSAEAIPADVVNSVTLTPVSGIVVLALEAAFAGEAAVDGEQSTFGRVRYRIDGLVPNETYTVNHPFASVTEVADVDGSINVTSDIGGFGTPGFPANFAIALTSDIGPFLTWDTFGQTPTDPALINPNPAYANRSYIGNPGIPHAVTGSPIGQNLFSVEGPGLTNFSTNLFTVTGRIADTTPPVITLNGASPASVTAGTAYVEEGATALDDFNGDVTLNIQVTSDVPAGNLVLGTGPFTVTYTVSDQAGNTAVSTRTVNVVADIVAPVITVNGVNPAFVLVGGNYADAGATASDNVDGVVAVTTTFADPLGAAEVDINTAVAGAHVVTYSATDSSLNTATLTRTVNVTADVTAPVVTLIGANPMGVTVGTAYVEEGATALDDFDGDLTAGITVTSDVPAGNLTAGTGPFTVTYSVTDLSNNTGTAVRTVNVVADIVAPVITLNGVSPMNVEIGSAPVDPGATALDNVDGTVTVTSDFATAVNTAAAGVLTVTYTATDSSLNVATLTRTVNVVADATVPVITLLGNAQENVLLNSVYTDAGATALDNIDGDLTLNIVVNNTVNTALPGTYTVDYSVNDSSLNAATAQRTVVVASNKAAGLGIAVQPSTSATAGSGLDQQPVFNVQNQFGDLMQTVQGNVTVNAFSDQAATTPAAMDGTATVALVNGQATFNDLSFPNEGEVFLRASLPQTVFDGAATLSGASEVPAVSTLATGTGSFILDTNANTLNFNLEFSGLGSAETAAHIHGPATASETAGPLLTLPAGSPKAGVWDYGQDPSILDPEALENNILNGLTYVNVHSVNFPDGEIRGQIVITPEADLVSPLSGSIVVSNAPANNNGGNNGGGGGGGGGIIFPVNPPTTPQAPSAPQTPSAPQAPSTPAAPSAPAGEVLGQVKFRFTQTLRVGLRNNEVAELQKRLAEEKVFNGPQTGFFGPLTQAALRAFQQKNNLPVSGVLDEATMAKFNAGGTLSAKLLKAFGDFKVFRITESGAKRHVKNPEEFKAFGLDWADVREVSAQELASFPEFRLMRANGDPKVFRVEDRQKTWIQTAEIFNNSGFRWEEIEDVNPSDLNGLSEIRLVRAENDTKVFKVKDNQKIWIKTKEDFERHFHWGQVEVTEASHVNGLHEVETEVEFEMEHENEVEIEHGVETEIEHGAENEVEHGAETEVEHGAETEVHNDNNGNDDNPGA